MQRFLKKINLKLSKELKFKSNFNTTKLNSLFDTLNSVTIWTLIDSEKRAEIFRFSPREIDYYLHKLYSYLY